MLCEHNLHVISLVSKERMNLRNANLSDVETIVSIIESTQEVQTVAKRGRGANITIVRDNLKRVLESETSSVLVVTTEENEVAGYCAVHWVPFLFQDGGEAYVTELFVDLRKRNTGVGTKLLDEVERQARTRGCSRLSLLNGRKSQAYERNFYSSRGWEERDSIANFILKIEKKRYKAVDTTAVSSPR